MCYFCGFPCQLDAIRVILAAVAEIDVSVHLTAIPKFFGYERDTQINVSVRLTAVHTFFGYAKATLINVFVRRKAVPTFFSYARPVEDD